MKQDNERQDNERGQALVEMALTFPFLLAIFLGIVEFAVICYGAIGVSNAAKAAAQFAAQNPNTAAQNPTAVAQVLVAAQRDIGGIPGITSAGLTMPAATTMIDGSALPSGTVCTTSGNGTVCSYCSCSSPDSTQAPFACLSANAQTQCTGISELEQNLIIETKISMNPIVTLPGFSGPFSLYGHAVVKRLQ